MVTWNRRDLLLESLAAVLGQDRPPDAVIVVDNASTDGTGDAVRAGFPAVRLATLAQNTGGAGGFAYGLALALADGADLVWLMDDDTVPEPGALRALLAGAGPGTGRPPVLLASRVLWTDGRAHPMNTPRAKPFASRGGAARRGRGRLRADPVGLVRVDPGRCRADPAARPAAGRLLPVERRLRVHHPAAARPDRAGSARPAWWCTRPGRSAAPTRDPGARFFYEVRNKIWTLQARGALSARRAGAVRRRHAAPLGPHVRAARPTAAALRSCLAKGVAAGLRSGPRPTAEVLAAAGAELPGAVSPKTAPLPRSTA